MLKTYASHFCGVGGACKGIHDAGLKCVLAIDNWQDALDTREANLGHKGTMMDIFEYKEDPSHAADLLWTSPVCQTFSNSSREFYTGTQQVRDELYMASVDYVRNFKPKYFILENVAGLVTHNIDHVGGGTLTKIKQAFESLGYHVEWNILDALDWGMPQYRERLFMVGSRDGKTGLIPKKPRLKEKPTLAHILERGVSSSAWCAQTYKTAMNKVERTLVSMRVMLPDDVFPTVTCGWGGGPTRKKVCVVDYTSDGIPFIRNPTIREASQAQGFPSDWIWPSSDTLAWRMVGNAVPPPIAKALVDHLQKIEAGGRPASAAPYLSSKKGELPKRGGKIPSYVSEIATDLPPDIEFD